MYPHWSRFAIQLHDSVNMKPLAILHMEGPCKCTIIKLCGWIYWSQYEGSGWISNYLRIAVVYPVKFFPEDIWIILSMRSIFSIFRWRTGELLSARGYSTFIFKISKINFIWWICKKYLIQEFPGSWHWWDIKDSRKQPDGLSGKSLKFIYLHMFSRFNMNNLRTLQRTSGTSEFSSFRPEPR